MSTYVSILTGSQRCFLNIYFGGILSLGKSPVLEGKGEEALPLTSALCFLPAFVQELRKRGSP